MAKPKKQSGRNEIRIGVLLRHALVAIEDAKREMDHESADYIELDKIYENLDSMASDFE